MKGWNTISTPYFAAMSKYGDFSVVGRGWEIRILRMLTVQRFSDKVLFTAYNPETAMRRGIISRAQRYKIKYNLVKEGRFIN